MPRPPMNLSARSAAPVAAGAGGSQQRRSSAPEPKYPPGGRVGGADLVSARATACRPTDLRSDVWRAWIFRQCRGAPIAQSARHHDRAISCGTSSQSDPNHRLEQPESQASLRIRGLARPTVWRAVFPCAELDATRWTPESYTQNPALFCDSNCEMLQVRAEHDNF